MIINEKTTIQNIINEPLFQDFGRLLFPVNRPISINMTLKDLSTSRIYIWYNHIQANKTVEIIQRLYDDAKRHCIFYNIYTEVEMQKDPSKKNTGLFFFKGYENAPFAICNAGGGFAYVGAMHDSFPHAIELSKKGYNAFALIYRVEHPYIDLARAISFIYDHSDVLKVNKNHYSLWGGSAGARMAASLGNKKVLMSYVGQDIPQADAVIMQYTGYDYASKDDAPTYTRVGTHDFIANYQYVKYRIDSLTLLNIPTEYHCYKGLPHGFGLGEGTIAEGWINDAITFWENQINRKMHKGR